MSKLDEYRKRFPNMHWYDSDEAYAAWCEPELQAEVWEEIRKKLSDGPDGDERFKEAARSIHAALHAALFKP